MCLFVRISKDNSREVIKINSDVSTKLMKVDPSLKKELLNHDNNFELPKEFTSKITDLYPNNLELVEESIKREQVNYRLFKSDRRNPELNDLITELNDNIKQQLNDRYCSSYSFDRSITRKMDSIRIKNEKGKPIKTLFILLSKVKPELTRFRNDIKEMLENKCSNNAFTKALEYDFYKDDKYIENLAKSLDNQKTPVIVKDDKIVFNDSKKHITQLLEGYINASNKNIYLKEITQHFFNFDYQFDVYDEKGNRKLYDKDFTYEKDGKKYTIPKGEKVTFTNFRHKLIYTGKDDLKEIKKENEKCKTIYNIRYHAFGKLKLTDDLENKFAKYWINFIYEECIKEVKRKNCVVNFGELENKIIGKLKNIINMQIIDLGKAVDYLYDYDNSGSTALKKTNLSSIDYQYNKFTDEFKQSTHQYLALSIASFLNIIEEHDLKLPKASKPEEVKDKKLVIQANTKKLFAFFGGYDLYKNEFDTVDKVYDLVTEITACLFQVRNDFFHKVSVASTKAYPLTEKIIEIEMGQYNNYLLEKYSSNNVFDYYSFADVNSLVGKCYCGIDISKSYSIPSFAKICSRSKHTIGFDDISKSSSYFLLKEIYNSDFRYNITVDKFIEKVDSVKDNIQEQHYLSYIRFTEFITVFCNDSDSVSSIYHKTLMLFAETKGKKNIFMKIIFNQILTELFNDYIDENYKFIKSPDKDNNDIQDDDNLDVASPIGIDKIDVYWYSFFKFCSPNSLTKMHGVIDSYSQSCNSLVATVKLKNLILTRLKKDDEITPYDIAPIRDLENLLQMNQFLKLYCGRISGVWQDYYETEDDFAESIAPFVKFDGKENAFDNLDKFQEISSIAPADKPITYVYRNGNSPVIHRTIEHAKMFGIYKFLEKNFTGYKVSKKEFDEYCNTSFVSIDENTVKKDELIKYYEARSNYVTLKNKVTFVDISSMSNVLFELYGRLISYQYRFERDQMYFLLGLTYFTSTNEDLHKNLSCVKNVYIYGKDVDGSKSTASIGVKLGQLLSVYGTKDLFANDIMVIAELIKPNAVDILLTQTQQDTLKALLKSELNQAGNALLIVNDLTDNKIITKKIKTDYKLIGILESSIDTQVVDTKNNPLLKVDNLIDKNIIPADIRQRLVDRLYANKFNDLEFSSFLRDNINILIYKSNFQMIKAEDQKTYYTDTRNSIDHFVLFGDQTYNQVQNSSILEFYNIMSLVFAYDRKSKNSVIPTFINILSKNFIDTKLLQANKDEIQADYKNLYDNNIDKDLFDKFKKHYKLYPNRFKSRVMIIKHSSLSEDFEYNRYSKAYVSQLFKLISAKN